MQRSIIAPAERVTNLRWGIALLLGIGILIASIDRSGVDVAALAAEHSFGLDFRALGYAVSAYTIAYALAQIPAGMLLDRFGVTLVGRIATFAWSLFALAGAAAGSLGMLTGTNLGLGLAKAPAYSLCAKATGYWFPVGERSTATAIFDAGAKLATMIGLPLLTVISVTFGWRAMLLMTGGLSLLFFGAFLLFYRDPATDTRLTHAERMHISEGLAEADGVPARGTIVGLFGQPKVWAMTIGFAAYSYEFFLFVHSVPSYLATTLQLPLRSLMIPWLVAAVVEVLAGGFLVDALIARGADASRVRKTVLVIGMLLGASGFGATIAHDPNATIAWITLSFAGLAVAAPVVWSLPSLIAPRGTVGTVAAIMNCANILVVVAAPFVTPLIIGVRGALAQLLLSATAALIVGILSYVFLLGRIEPIAES